MKKLLMVLVVLTLLVSGCAQSNQAAATNGISLKVGDGKVSKMYTVENLKGMTKTQASFKNVNYVGVKMSDLLTAAGFDPQAVKAVKAVATDGFSVNYEPALFQRADVIVAYQAADGALAAEDGSFRMVLPGAEGKLNVRMLVEIQVVP
jgi:hypothetical protein